MLRAAVKAGVSYYLLLVDGFIWTVRGFVDVLIELLQFKFQLIIIDLDPPRCRSEKSHGCRRSRL